MQHRIVIPGCLPGLNEYINAERTNRYKAAKMKRHAQDQIICAAKASLRGVRYLAPVLMHYIWVEPNKRRDKDNIAFARKFVQDALVEIGVLQNDGWKEIEGFTDSFKVDAKNPRVEIIITEEKHERRKTVGTNDR